MTKREQFFYDNAGFSYNPETETQEDGRIRCAQEMAKVEDEAQALGMYLDVSKESDCYAWHASGDFDIVTSKSILEDGDDTELYPSFLVELRTHEGETVGSVGGVTFDNGTQDSPTQERRTYERVLFAELASEFFAEEQAK